MKKLFSSILALAMALSLCTISAQAGTAGNYAITYEAIGDADITNLKADDMFWAVVTLKDAEGIFGGGFGFTWDSTKITTVNSSGTEKTGFSTVTSSRIDATATTEGFDVDAGEMAQVAAFERNEGTCSAGSITYAFSAASILDENEEGDYYDYAVSGDTTIMKVRFKVLVASDPAITVNRSEVQETKADGVLRTATSSVAAFPIGGGEEKTEATIGATGDVTFDYAEGDSASSALSGKRVVLDTANKVSGDVKGKKVAVTYTAAGADPIVKKFGETLDALLGLDSDGGNVEAAVRFGIVCDPDMTGTFTFAIVD